MLRRGRKGFEKEKVEKVEKVEKYWSIFTDSGDLKRSYQCWKTGIQRLAFTVIFNSK